MQSSKEKVLDILGRKCKLCGSRKGLEIHHILPYWLWRYVDKTDKGAFSTKFISNYEVLCRSCHMERHIFIMKNLFYGFHFHYWFKMKWNREIVNTHFTYEFCFDESGCCSWHIGKRHIPTLHRLNKT